MSVRLLRRTAVSALTQASRISFGTPTLHNQRVKTLSYQRYVHTTNPSTPNEVGVAGTPSSTPNATGINDSTTTPNPTVPPTTSENEPIQTSKDDSTHVEQEPINPEEYARRQAAANGVADEDEDGGEESGSTPFRSEEDPNQTTERNRILEASLPHVFTYGWSMAAIQAGCTSIGLASVGHEGLISGPIDLVYYVQDQSIRRMKELLEKDESFQKMNIQQKLEKAIRTKLEAQAKYHAIWPQALGLAHQPQYMLRSTCRFTEMIDEIWYLCGDKSTDLSWYTKRTLLSGVYGSTELFWLTDRSIDFESTWMFLSRRIQDSMQLNELSNQAQNGIQYATNIGAMFVEKIMAQRR